MRTPLGGRESVDVHFVVVNQGGMGLSHAVLLAPEAPGDLPFQVPKEPTDDRGPMTADIAAAAVSPCLCRPLASNL